MGKALVFARWQHRSQQSFVIFDTLLVFKICTLLAISYACDFWSNLVHAWRWETWCLTCTWSSQIQSRWKSFRKTRRCWLIWCIALPKVIRILRTCDWLGCRAWLPSTVRSLFQHSICLYTIFLTWSFSSNCKLAARFPFDRLCPCMFIVFDIDHSICYRTSHFDICLFLPPVKLQNLSVILSLWVLNQHLRTFFAIIHIWAYSFDTLLSSSQRWC